jgi:hypothetical protein
MWGVFVYWYGPFYFGSDRSAVSKQFKSFQYHSVDLLLNSSTANHVKNNAVLCKYTVKVLCANISS